MSLWDCIYLSPVSPFHCSAGSQSIQTLEKQRKRGNSWIHHSVSAKTFYPLFPSIHPSLVSSVLCSTLYLQGTGRQGGSEYVAPPDESTKRCAIRSWKEEGIHSKLPCTQRVHLDLPLTCNFPTRGPRRKVRRKKIRMEGRMRVKLTRSSMVAMFVFQPTVMWVTATLGRRVRMVQRVGSTPEKCSTLSI